MTGRQNREKGGRVEKKRRVYKKAINIGLEAKSANADKKLDKIIEVSIRLFQDHRWHALQVHAGKISKWI